MAWPEIRAAITGMLAEAGYTVRESKGVSTTEERYVVVVSHEETDRSTGNYVGNNQYRIERPFTLWVYNKRAAGVKDIDAIMQAARDECEPILADFKRLFGTVYNEVGDAGGIILKYGGVRFVDVPASGAYAPVRMEARFTVQFIESRLNVSDKYNVEFTILDDAIQDAIDASVGNVIRVDGGAPFTFNGNTFHVELLAGQHTYAASIQGVGTSCGAFSVP